MKWAALGLVLLLAAAGCTSNASEGEDSDGDGLDDQLEREGWSSQIVEFMDRRVEVEFHSNPTMVDTDGDGLTDQEEFFLRTNPSETDTDGDGLTDCQETRHTVAAECESDRFDTETDGDGGYATDPRKADSDPGPSVFKIAQPWMDEAGGQGPQWGDGLSDGDEILGYWVLVGERNVRVQSDPRRTDSDGDGLEDGEEAYTYGSLPHVPDSDGDGCTDTRDLWPGRDATPRLGLESFTLTHAPAGTHAAIRITTLFFSESRTVPDEPRTVAEGETWDTQEVDVVVTNAEACTVHNRDGWLRIQLIVHDTDSQQNVDVASDSGLGDGNGVVVWWHPRTDRLAQDHGDSGLGDTFDGVSGTHGELRFRPTA